MNKYCNTCHKTQIHAKKPKGDLVCSICSREWTVKDNSAPTKRIGRWTS